MSLKSDILNIHNPSETQNTWSYSPSRFYIYHINVKQMKLNSYW